MIGKNISHYRIIEKLGQGGMGEVFLARDTSLERNVAIKFLPPEMRNDPVARERFLREAKAVATLDHPHICVVHETGEAEGAPFIVMEYVEGESLRERLARGPLPLGETLRLAAEIAEALEEAHSRHIIHRDLKPANVMLTRTGHAKVMDFGLAKRLLSAQEATEEETLTELTRMGTTVGTLAYMSPEQLQGQPADHRSDIFSFGALLCEMLTGVHPFRKNVGVATAAAILSEDPAPLVQQATGLPQQLVKLVLGMLTKTPAQRPQSMRVIHEQLKGILVEVQPRPDETGVLNLKRLGRSLRRPRVLIPAAAVLMALAFLGTWYFNYRAKVRWAREEALPQIERLIEENNVWRNLIPVYRLAEKAEAIIPRDARLAELFAKCSLKINIKTEPPDARIFMKEYEAPDSEWSYLGVSPIEKIRLPIGVFRWKIEKDGYETVLAAASTWNANGDASKHDVIIPYDLFRTLDKQGSIPAGMVRVQGAETALGKLGDFYIDRYEVTNRQYREFIDKGGYKKKEYWKHKLVKDGKEPTWEEAARAFVDQTGQPGPATWQGGDYPEGQGDYPVSGVSWYEAAAYADFAGKSLPTGYHWGMASGEYTPIIQIPQLGGFALLVPFTNFKGRGPVPVGSLPGLTAFGAFDMAGNVREWCSNETPKGRLIRGGAWGDNTYMFGNFSQAPAMDRSDKNGFRCAFYPDPDKIPRSSFQAMQLGETRDYYREKPVPDAIFRVYREQFAYDKRDLRANTDSKQISPGGWTQEKVSFDAAYGSERVSAYLFLPRNTMPPYQTVIYFPGSASEFQRSSRDIESYYEFPLFLAFIVKNGRAVLYPVYKGTFERGDKNTMEVLEFNLDSHQHTEIFIQVVKDFKRCIDYLETRPDIDGRKLAYYGMSWGGVYGAIIPAVEERLKASVLVAGGFSGNARPEADQINYVTRVKIPTLMLNGKYDTILQRETSSKPMFDLLGTPAQDKQQKFYETDHIPPVNEFIKETLAWLDRYLGPVK
jgi:formylglycine-generating enzyme required for sulfatase activity/dienelactone hydrolase/predicted Ser/Thr protein kinase